EQTPRKVIDGYNLKFLDASMVMTASIVILAYILWSMSSDVPEKFSNPNTYLTALFVVLGIMRYLQISLVEERSGNPTKILLKDTFLQLTLIGWVGSFVWILYL
ncbi:MAG: prenyltransferase, partial [Desulfovermiculus sp.]